MSNLNLQKLHEWVWLWPWTFNNGLHKCWADKELLYDFQAILQETLQEILV